MPVPAPNPAVGGAQAGPLAAEESQALQFKANRLHLGSTQALKLARAALKAQHQPCGGRSLDQEQARARGQQGQP